MTTRRSSSPLSPLSLALGSTFALVATSALASSSASAQEAQTSWAPRLYVDGQLGAFGDVRVSNGDSSSTDGLEPSGGGVIGIDVPVVPIFSLGVETGATVWNSEGGQDWEIDPSVLVHISFMPRLRLPFGNGDQGGGHGAVYLAAQVGPTLSFVSDDLRDAVGSIGGSIDTGIGLHGGGLLGAQIFFTRHVGIDIAAGYTHHVFWHDVNGPLGSDTTLRVDLGQAMFRAGFAYAF